MPESDVPFAKLGCTAVIQMDVLPGLVFKTAGEHQVQVSRFAESEDPHRRMMRAVVHVTVPDDRLRRGMYGRVKLIL